MHPYTAGQLPGDLERNAPLLDRSARSTWLAAVLASLILSACGGGPTPAPVISSFTASPASVDLGTPSTLSWSVSDATSLSIDSGIGAVTGSTKAVIPGSSTTYTMTATGPGGSVTRAVTVTVTLPPTVLEVACSGRSCGALSASHYSGAGIGLWRYRNTTAVAQAIDIHVGGVSSGDGAALVFSNGTAVAASRPAVGAVAFPAAAALRTEQPFEGDPGHLARDGWHQALLEENRRIGLSLRGEATAMRIARPTALAAPALPTPAVGATRTWNEIVASPVAAYSTVAQAVCDLPGGRKAVFWVDPASTTSGSLTADDLSYFQTTFCGVPGAGVDGGFGRVKALLGDVWGSVDPTLSSVVISDAPTLQDVNVVFLEVPGALTDKNWAGYFWGGNNILRSASPLYASSNQALAFFVDATQVHVRDTSRGYIGSALLHELTHMVNFYQRTVVRDRVNDTWLEETTATMIDDIVPPAATPDHVTIIPSQRIRPYVASGGAITLVGWEYPDQDSYSLAGAFGAFVNRRYGTSILSGTIDCPGTGIDCVDGLIRAGGGVGFADEFERVGASIFGVLPGTGTPEGFGYPMKVTGGYTLAAIDVSTFAVNRKATATALTVDFPAGSHTYRLDAIGAGQAVYSREGVVVPPGTSILLVIQQEGR